MTPVDVEKYDELLKQANYDKTKSDYLVSGFKNGFRLHFEGDRTVKRESKNLKLRCGSKIEMWNKIMTEVKVGRYARLYQNHPPFEHYYQSPLGLVPKDKGKKTRLIFHLSYPRNGDSVNSGIPKNLTSVKYPDFDEVI